MKPSDFEPFYLAVHGHAPFPWQKRLAAMACVGDWPETLRLPTASGKTSAIDVAVFALAWQADRKPRERTARMRTAFVVDRRVVVDEAYEHARKIAKALEKPAVSVVREVAERLRSFHKRDGLAPLCVALLRGGLHRDERWTEAPDQPTIILSTVDQVGSRLLFRGYGVPARSWPIHAGLMGIDTRIVLDEAHLSSVFEETVKYVAQLQEKAPQNNRLPRSVVLNRMSATVGADSDSLALDEEDRTNRELLRRLQASKPAVLREAKDLVSAATTIAARGYHAGRVVGVVVNRVRTAREIFDEVRKLLPIDDVVLLTGRIRPRDRERLWGHFGPRMKVKRDVSGPLVVVATQTVEVGANVDFDELATEAAPLDALRQRFGRLNRLGSRSGPAQATLLVRPADIGKKASDDPVYGDRIRTTWSWLLSKAAAVGDDRVVDFGIDALDKLLEGVEVASLVATRPLAPVVLGSHIDAWSRTYPTPNPDPPVAPYLHGPDAFDAADVQVVWRVDLEEGSEDRWAELVAAVPPRIHEVLPLRVGQVRAWLSGGKPGDASDVEGVSSAEGQDRAGDLQRKILRWAGPDDSELIDAEKINPGDTIVVPASYGGCDPFGWNPDLRAPVQDVGDEPISDPTKPGVRTRWRLHPALLDSGADRVARLYLEIAKAEEQQGDVDEILGELRDLFGVPSAARLVRYGAHWLALLGKPKPGEFADDDDSSLVAGRLSLAQHSQDVRNWSERFSVGCGLDSELQCSVMRAGWLHDVGKADLRMQRWLAEGPPPPVPIAKSGMDWRDRDRNRRARDASGYPKGARHEVQSVAMVLSCPEALSGTDADLVLHLIGTHHGYGRPFAPVIHDPDTIDVAFVLGDLSLRATTQHRLARLDSGWAERFSRVQNTYGPWGLAWLEAVLRLADHRASATGTPNEGVTGGV